jgi:hypothetical protein
LETVIWIEVRKILSPIVDYLGYLKTQNKKFDKLPVIQAIEKQKAWHKELAKTSNLLNVEEDGVCKVFECVNGFYWVEVFGEKSLNREGQEMGTV